MATEVNLTALNYSVSFIFVSFGIMDPLLNFETIRGLLMRLKWLKLASLAQKTCSLYTFSSLVYSLLPKDSHLKDILK